LKQNLPWEKLGFAYRETNCHIRYTWRDGSWDDGTLSDSPYFNMHIAATALHYGQSAFEGLKAFQCKDGTTQIFRPQENAARIQMAAERVLMPDISESLFLEAVKKVVTANLDYVPPYGTGGALYIRPLLFGSGHEIGLTPASEYTFIVLVTPVGDYYSAGVKAIDGYVTEEFDRAAARGVGHVKVAGNYASSLLPKKLADEEGFPITLFLDSVEHKYIEEFGTSNFIGITKDNKYVTPKTSSILPSITNKSLMTLAKDMGMTVEQRSVPYAEINSFVEIGACGTAVVISPIKSLTKNGEKIEIQKEIGFGPKLGELYHKLTAIQRGELPDSHHWLEPIK
jgi:branched-chain amino acid aminotransferase